MTIAALTVLCIAAVLVAARLGVSLGFEQGYNAGLRDAVDSELLAEQRKRDEARRNTYLRHFGGQINAGKRGEN